MHIDLSDFASTYENLILQLNTLTPHQSDAVKTIQADSWWAPCMSQGFSQCMCLHECMYVSRELLEVNPEHSSRTL